MRTTPHSGQAAAVAVAMNLLALNALGAAPGDWEARSRALADQLSTELKTELQAALQSGGPVAAVAVCRVRAPEIAARLSAASGAEVGRTALRLRNPGNEPDELERAVLLQFAAEMQPTQTHSPTIAPPAPPEAVFELRTPDGIEHRYLRAIPMQAPCVTCHGKTIAPDLARVIDQLYPADAARGFVPGELRGAVSVRWPAEP